MQDIFDFWAECPADARIHPQDKPVFARRFISDMGFDLKCLPACFAGRLRSAPVVLLYLSPGWAQSDVDEASTPAAQARYFDRRKGDRPLDTHDEHPEHHTWWASRTKVFGPPDIVREKIAILNLGAYHSKEFDGHLGLSALPSCRVSLDWAHTVLFPAALEGRRTVVCMRSAASWGLETSKNYEGTLFAPPTVRGGHMRKKDEDHSAYRERVIAAVRSAIGADESGS